MVPEFGLIMESRAVVLNDADIAELRAPFHNDTARLEPQNRGLRIIKQTVALHGGGVIANSTKSGGTSIELRFN